MTILARWVDSLHAIDGDEQLYQMLVEMPDSKRVLSVWADWTEETVKLARQIGGVAEVKHPQSTLALVTLDPRFAVDGVIERLGALFDVELRLDKIEEWIDE